MLMRLSILLHVRPPVNPENEAGVFVLETMETVRKVTGVDIPAKMTGRLGKADLIRVIGKGNSWMEAAIFRYGNIAFFNLERL
jgi:hypothetical protein